jgi:predicted MFS family arabinose efflux permease
MSVSAAPRATAVHLAERLSCFNPDEPRVGNRWPAVWSIGAGSFSLVFAEVIPVGLLAHLSHSLHVSIGAGGLTIVIPAVTAALAAPLLTLGSAAIERRALLRALGLLMLVSNVVAALTPNFGVMLVSRALLGVAIGGFWVFGSGAAISLVDEDARGKALAIVSGGIFIATVAALPASALIGHLSTWRLAFWIAAGMSAASILAQGAVLPCLGKGKKIAASALLTIVRIPASRVGLASTSAIFFAEFAAYTYVTPMLDRRTGFSAGEATLVLLGFGLAGGLTNFAAGLTTRNYLRQTLIAAGLLIGATAALLTVADSSKVATVVLVLVWGAGFGAVPVAAQAWMATTMPADVEGALSLFVTGLQGSLAAGSALGGVLYNAYGPTGPLTLAAIVAAGASSILFVKSARAVDRKAAPASAAAAAPAR